MIMVPFLFSVALALAYAAYKATGEAWDFLIAALVLASLPVCSVQARTLQFYPVVLFFGYAGLVAALFYVRSGNNWALAGATAGLVGAIYSYNIGVLFLPIPILYLLVDRSRTVTVRLGTVYLAVLAFALPFIFWHLTVGGLDGLFKQETWWMTEKGYLLIRNLEFRDYGSASPVEFLGKFPGMVQRAAGSIVLPLGVLSILGLIRLPGWRWRTLAILSLAVPISGLIYTNPAALLRYAYVLLPAMILLAVYGSAGLLQILRSYKWSVDLAPAVGIGVIVLLGVSVLDNARGELKETEGLMDSPAQRELTEMASLIDDGKAVLGTRSWALIPYLLTTDLLGPQSVPEDDFVTFLSWPSEAAVTDVFQRNNVGWVLIRSPAGHWEVDYHVWLKKVTGQLPQHDLMLRTSQQVETVYDGEKYILYKVRDGRA